jgi:hypothetical protein
MNKRLIVSAVLVVSILLLGWLFFRKTVQHEPPTIVIVPVAPNKTTQHAVSKVTPSTPSTVVTSKIVRTQMPIGPQVVRLFKSTNYPPHTAEEKAMWDWWDKMDKADSDFQWKMPIEFYGKVVDQFGKPVDHAEVILNWTTVIGPVPDPKKSIFTGTDGRFDVTDIQGKGISVDIRKEGYDRTIDSQGDFEYAAFYQDDFHVPDPNNPVVFRLHKTMEAEPLYVFSPYGYITPGDEPLILNVESGKIATQGDLAFSVILGVETNRYGSDFIVTMRGLNGAGFVFSDEEFLSMAPELGYQNIFSVTQKINAPNYRPEQVLRFYVRTSTGKYASIGVRIKLWGNFSRADFDAGIHFNPSGSRNLEFDQNKWINP